MGRGLSAIGNMVTNSLFFLSFMCAVGIHRPFYILEFVHAYMYLLLSFKSVVDWVGLCSKLDLCFPNNVPVLCKSSAVVARSCME